MHEPGGKNRPVWTPAESAVIEFTESLTGYPGSISEQDLEKMGKHFSEKQIVELLLTIGTANFTNRFNEGARVPVDV